MNATQAFAATFVDQLAESGVAVACLSPGSRSAPLAMALARHPRIRVLVHLDERSCAFFGLGLAKAAGRPVAILCTSGTAAAEFHPAVLEAHHSRTPLLVLTADRPPELREVGANQAVEQARLYGGAVRWAFDPGPPEARAAAAAGWRRLALRAVAESLGPPAGPVHLNLPFREPLTPDPGLPPEPLPAGGAVTAVPPLRAVPPPSVVDLVVDALRRSRRPLVVAGEMRDGARLAPCLAELASRAGAAVLAEPSSQLRVRGMPGLVEAYDALVRVPGWADGHFPDLVLRLGAVPTSKALNLWLRRAPACRTLLVDPGGGWLDPDLLASDLLRFDPQELLEAVAARLDAEAESSWQAAWIEAGLAAAAALERALASTSLHEGHAVRSLARQLPEKARVLVGSSMPIRDVDTFWPAAQPGQRFYGNRGASGIDGLVSTGLGVAAAGPEPTVLLLGDLSLYHDMNGLWAIRRHRLRATLVVLDNDGGGIFSFLPQAEHEDVFEELFGTPLGLRLEDVARLYGLDFRALDEAGDVEGCLAESVASARSTLVAVRFTRPSSVRGHRECWEAVAAALR